MINTKLSHFTITGKLGEGGMGEVYRAQDNKLGREVAVKLLPQAVANDPERMRRFEREARVLASLNHSNIGALYSLESAVADAKPITFLVMELVEGEDLAQRLARTPLPIEEALSLGLQIAEAIEAAHEKGVVHRDLKPANVVVSPAGQAKVLDFGIAKALDLEEPSAGQSSPGDARSELPTSAPHATAVGVVMGTLGYMAPEQARGETVDKRCDIWSFGVLLHELLTGRPLFTGTTAPDLLAAVMTQDIDLRGLPANVPRRVRELLARCLDREPRQRLRDIGEARIQIRRALDDDPADADDHVPPRVSAAERWVTLLIAAAAVAAAGTYAWRSGRGEELPPTRRVASELVATGPLQFATSRGPMALSPDGSHLAFVAVDANGVPALAVRALDGSGTRILPGTDDASSPFWSPDGGSLGFFAHRKLQRIDLAGGRPRILAEAPVPEGGTWNAAGVILYAPGDWGQPIMQVDADGGVPTPVVDLGPGRLGEYHLRPSFLPDGRRFVFSVLDQYEASTGIYLGDLETGDARLITADHGLHAVYAEPGILLVWQEGIVTARAIDLDTLELGDDARRVADQVRAVWPATGLFAVSGTGMLVFLAGEDNVSGSELVWVNRDGQLSETLAPSDQYYYPRISHDGRRVVVDRSAPLADLWVYDLQRRVPSRFTSSEVDDTLSVWSADDSEIYYLRAEGGYFIHAQALTGNQPSRQVVANGSPTDSSPDGRYLLFRRHEVHDGAENQNPWTLEIATGTERPWLATPFSERTGRFSPDGRWIAYTSDRSGRMEIYLQSFPELGETIPVSSSGGTMPVWRRDGQELFYWSADGELTAVPIALGDEPRIGDAVPLFQVRLRDIGGWNAQYDVADAGQRFLLNRMVENPTSDPMILIQGWFDAAGMTR